MMRAAEKVGIKLDAASAEEIARRSRGTPRIALKLLKRVRDFSQIHNGNNVDEASVKNALDLLSVDHMGLDESDRRFFDVFIEKPNGGAPRLGNIVDTLF